MKDSGGDVGSLLSGDFVTAEKWLRQVLDDGKPLLEGFNWHGFAEGAARNARSREDDQHASDAWATMSVTVYDRLAAEQAEGFTFELSAMNLRALLISRHGSADGHPVRDAARLVKWFREGVADTSLEEVEREAERLRQLPVEQLSEQLDVMRRLRRIKNRLNVFRWQETVRPPDIERWLAIWDRLP